jgi:hypothetical protein
MTDGEALAKEHVLILTEAEAGFLAGLLLNFGEPGRWQPRDDRGYELAAGLLEKLVPIAEAIAAASLSPTGGIGGPRS